MPSPSLLPQRRMTVPDPNKSRCTRRQTAGTPNPPFYNPLRLPLPPWQNPPSRNIRILLSASDVVQKLQPNETRPSAMNSIQHTKERGICRRERDGAREAERDGMQMQLRTSCDCSLDDVAMRNLREILQESLNSVARSFNCGPKAAAATAAQQQQQQQQQQQLQQQQQQQHRPTATAILLQCCSLGEQF